MIRVEKLLYYRKDVLCRYTYFTFFHIVKYLNYLPLMIKGRAVGKNLPNSQFAAVISVSRLSIL